MLTLTMQFFQNDPDTKIGGEKQKFPVTDCSAIRNVRSNDDEVRQRAFDQILENYWKPVYKYVRIKWNAGNEDAKDLTQGFFAEAFEKNHFNSYDPDKAKFQTFLRTCLDGYISNQHKSDSRLKRGGNLDRVSLDFVRAEEELEQSATSRELDAEDFLYHEWVRTLFTNSLEVMRQRLITSGREVHFQIFSRYDLNEEQNSRPSYAMLAEEFQLDVNTVNNRLAAARREFKTAVLDALREITATEEEFQREAKTLLGVEIK